MREGNAVLAFAMEAHGYGAMSGYIAASRDAKIQQLMAKMKAMTAKPLSSYSHEWKACRSIWLRFSRLRA